MPHPMPPHLKDWLRQQMPPTHKMWWMRATIMDIQPMRVQQGGPPSHYFRLMVMDIDAPASDKRGYEIDVNGRTFKDYRPQDRVSLFGHEPIDATHLSYPRFFYHHEAGVEGPCHQTHFVDRNFRPIPDLIADVEGSQRDRMKKLVGGIASAVGLLREEVTHRLVGGGFNMRPLYEEVAYAVDLCVKQYPDPRFSCINPRPENQQGGALVD